MPKYCSVPNCKNDGNGSERKSFYKFPLQDPVRLQQWLSNMRRGSWTPSRHQYICHEHFAPSCFKVRWGIRYLESDAVPTVFPEVEKRKAVDPSEAAPKRLRAHHEQSVALTGDGMPAADATEREGETSHGVHLLEITVDPSPQGESSRLEASDAGESDCPLTADLESVVGFKPVPSFPLTLFQTGRSLTNGEEVVVMSERPFGAGPGELAAILTLSEEPSGGTQVLAYLETMPSVFHSEPAVRPDTVLASALSAEPITSTLPIVSKHIAAPAASLDTGEEDDVTSEEEEEEEEHGVAERPDHQLEEHCYHKSSLSEEQLEAIVGELQKKVKVLQQRHRRHLEKLLGLENTVSQLRQSNLLNEERLQLLERACIQSGSAGSGGAETVTIIYEEDDNAAYLYTPLVAADQKL
nr:THAP domain-containing protein 5-like [Gasterosteus aculeatus aculeatus]